MVPCRQGHDAVSNRLFDGVVGAGYLIGIASGLAMLVGILIAWAGFVPYYTITGILPDGMTMQKFAGSVYQQRVKLSTLSLAHTSRALMATVLLGR